jgi:hypothetical protein
MAPRLRKALPKDFGEIVASGDLDAMTAVFGTCDLDARGGYSKEPALSFFGVPEELIRWLVGRGADIDAPDRYGRTPLYAHAESWSGLPGLLIELGADVDARDDDAATPLFASGPHPAHVRTLVEAGADIDARDDMGDTPLLHHLRRCANADIDRVAPSAAILVEAGALVTDEMRDEVRRIGADFEAARDVFDPDSLAETDAALRRLYTLFSVDAAPALVRHDGVSPIRLPDAAWPERFGAAWDLLVPAQGAAATVQGEAVRIAGRVAHEIHGNGGANWDRDYRTMLAALPGLVAQGEALGDADLAEVRALAAGMRGGAAEGPELDRLRELVVAWAARNPSPIPLGDPAYGR